LWTIGSSHVAIVFLKSLFKFAFWIFFLRLFVPSFRWSKFLAYFAVSKLVEFLRISPQFVVNLWAWLSFILIRFFAIWLVVTNDDFLHPLRLLRIVSSGRLLVGWFLWLFEMGLVNIKLMILKLIWTIIIFWNNRSTSIALFINSLVNIFTLF
jgi:hypothetical protein